MCYSKTIPESYKCIVCFLSFLLFFQCIFSLEKSILNQLSCLCVEGDSFSLLFISDVIRFLFAFPPECNFSGPTAYKIVTTAVYERYYSLLLSEIFISGCVNILPRNIVDFLNSRPFVLCFCPTLLNGVMQFLKLLLS